MLQPRWRKVWRDLWFNRSRTILVILSIAVGVFAVGVIATSRTVLSEQLNRAFMATRPASSIFLTFSSFDENIVETIENMRTVEAAEARRVVSVRVRLGENEWQQLQLIAIQDFEEITVDRILPDAGQWPPDDRELLIETSALGLVEAEIGQTITIKDPDGKLRQMPIVGTADDVYAKFQTMGGIAHGYITVETLAWLGEPESFNDLRFIVAEHPFNREHIKDISAEVQDKLESANMEIWFNLIPIPGQHPMNFLIDPILALLAVLSVLALGLSLFLVINMVSALLTQQQKQIGIMKAIGAGTGQIAQMYYVAVLIFGGLSLLIAVPLGVGGAYLLSVGVASMLNLNLDEFYLPLSVLLLQIGVGLLVPLLAATYPIISGTRVTVREAISGYGLGQGKFGSGLIDRVLVNLHSGFVNRPTLISLRNTFRRKGRLSLTLITLIMGGAIFMTVFSVQASLQSTLDALLNYFQYDVAVQFTRPYRIERVDQELAQVEGVVFGEGWVFANTRVMRADGTESDNITTLAPPADTQLVEPTMLRGRWLRPGDTNAIVINTLVLNSEPNLDVGDRVTLKILDKEREWVIVGIAMGGGIFPTMFTNYEELSKTMGQIHETQFIFTRTAERTPEYRRAVLTRLEQHLSDRGFRIGVGITVDEDVQSLQTMFAVIVVLMLAMAVMLAVVGALGLMGTMSINVLERTREVGVIRAVGASDWAVIQIVTVEGVLIGLISWLVSAVIALPLSRLISDTIGRQFIGAELSYVFSVNGMLMWLVLVIILAAVASFLPAWSAARLTVREVLAYEG